MKEGGSDGGIKLMVWHGIAVVLAIWTGCHAFFLLPEPDFTGVDPEIARACKVRMNMRILYLSGWNYVAYGVFVFFSFVQDVKPDRRLRGLLDWVFTTYILPFSLLVPIVFWTAASVSYSLLVPAPLSPLLTPLLNHTVHSSVAFGVALELITRPVRFPSKSRRKIATARRHKLLLAWQIMSYMLYATTGVFMYPISGMIGWPLRLVLDGCMHIVLLTADFIPRILADCWWNPKRSILFKNIPLQSAADFVFNRKTNQTQFSCKIRQRRQKNVR